MLTNKWWICHRFIHRLNRKFTSILCIVNIGIGAVRLKSMSAQKNNSQFKQQENKEMTSFEFSSNKWPMKLWIKTHTWYIYDTFMFNQKFWHFFAVALITFFHKGKISKNLKWMNFDLHRGNYFCDHFWIFYVFSL